jgi:hypothetical protein
MTILSTKASITAPSLHGKVVVKQDTGGTALETQLPQRTRAHTQRHGILQRRGSHGDVASVPTAQNDSNFRVEIVVFGPWLPKAVASWIVERAVGAETMGRIFHVVKAAAATRSCLVRSGMLPWSWAAYDARTQAMHGICLHGCTLHHSERELVHCQGRACVRKLFAEGLQLLFQPADISLRCLEPRARLQARSGRIAMCMRHFGGSSRKKVADERTGGR